MISLFYVSLFIFHFDFLVFALMPQGHYIMYFKRQCLDRDKIEFLTANRRQLMKTDKAHREEDNVKEQAPFP
jgi:hypothetical protein